MFTWVKCPNHFWEYLKQPIQVRRSCELIGFWSRQVCYWHTVWFNIWSVFLINSAEAGPEWRSAGWKPEGAIDHIWVRLWQRRHVLSVICGDWQLIMRLGSGRMHRWGLLSFTWGESALTLRALSVRGDLLLNPGLCERAAVGPQPAPGPGPLPWERERLQVGPADSVSSPFLFLIRSEKLFISVGGNRSPRPQRSVQKCECN